MLNKGEPSERDSLCPSPLQVVGVSPSDFQSPGWSFSGPAQKVMS